MKIAIIAIIINLFVFGSIVFSAAPVYTEGITYQVEVLEDGQIQVRQATRVYKDGVEISKSYHRHVLAPEANLTKEVKKVKDIANVVWTPEVIAEYKIEKAKRELESQ